MAKSPFAAALVAVALSGCASQRAERAQLYASEVDDDIYCQGLGYRVDSPFYIDCRMSARQRMTTGQTDGLAALRRALEGGRSW